MLHIRQILTLLVVAILWLNCKVTAKNFISSMEKGAPNSDFASVPKCRQACNTSLCPQITKCRRGRLALDRWNCCQVCYRQEGQLCHPSRRPCDPTENLFCVRLADDFGGDLAQDNRRNTSASGRKKSRCQRNGMERHELIEVDCCSQNKSQWIDGCLNCSCINGVKQCTRLNCPLPPGPPNCLRYSCQGLSMPGTCCPLYYGHCICEVPAPTVSEPTATELPPQCSRQPLCQVKRRGSGKNERDLRYVFNERTQRCVMFWHNPECPQDNNFQSLRKCRESCLPPGRRCEERQHRCAVITQARSQFFCYAVENTKQLFRGKVSGIEQLSNGIMYTIRIQRIYRGSCKVNSKIHLFSPGRNLSCSCPNLERHHSFLLGFDRLTDDCNSRHIGRFNVTAIVIGNTPNSLAVPWSKEIEGILTDTCELIQTTQQLQLT